MNYFSATLWNMRVYASGLEAVHPYVELEKFRSRRQGFNGNRDFWSIPSPEPELPSNWVARLTDNPASALLCEAALRLAETLQQKYDPEQVLFVAILRAGVPLADWLTRLLPGSKAVATSLFVGLGIDQISLNHIKQDFPGKQMVFVDGWTGKGGVAGELKRQGLGPLAVLIDPWRLADFRGTSNDVLSPSAFFTGPITLGFSRTFTVSPDVPFAAFHFPKELLCNQLVQSWRDILDTTPGPGMCRNDESNLVSHDRGSSANPSPFFNPSTEHQELMQLRLHSNEVVRALINSNPSEVLFRDNKTIADADYGLLVDLASLHSIPITYGVSRLEQVNSRVACRLMLI